MRTSLRIACYQGPPRGADTENLLESLNILARQAEHQGAGLLIGAEMGLTGYAIGADRVAQRAEPLDGPTMTRVRQIAKENGIALLVGFPERDGAAIYNSIAFIGADGSDIACYRKSHLFGEVDRDQFTPGPSQPPVFDFAGLRVGLLICYDVEFPETVRALALRGADLVLVPTALMYPAEIVAETVVVSRAFENQVYLAYVNRCDSEAAFDYCGLSCVVAPDGKVVARAGAEEEMIFADVYLSALSDVRSAHSHLVDRRVDHYDALVSAPRTTKDIAP